MRRDMALKKLTFQHTILSLEAAIILIYYNSGRARMTDWALDHDHCRKVCCHTAYYHHQTYALCVMHYAPHVPASHDGSDAKAMQDENYA